MHIEELDNQTFELTLDGFPSCIAKRYQPSTEIRGHILYLHGGGFFFGECDDLPDVAKEAFSKAGLELICLNYPLAPHFTLDQIVDATCQLYQAIHDHLQLKNVLFFGRSAGAYLCYQLAAKFYGMAYAPSALAAFYGFYDLVDPALTRPSKRYTSLRPVAEKVIETAKTKARSVASLVSAYEVYVYARQGNRWLKLLGNPSQKAFDISLLPPLFLVASTNDEDVPYSYSKKLWRQLPGTTLKTYYGLPHEVDVFAKPDEVAALYTELAEWMKAQL